PGDTVAVGDVLVEIETDKAVMEYEAYQAGTLATILVPEGQNADIGAPIALLDDGTGGPPPPASPPTPQRSSFPRVDATPARPRRFRGGGGGAGRRRLAGRERKQQRGASVRVAPGAEAGQGEPSGPVARHGQRARRAHHPR